LKDFDGPKSVKNVTVLLMIIQNLPWGSVSQNNQSLPPIYIHSPTFA